MAMIQQEEYLLIRDLFDQGVSKSAIARITGLDRKTVARYVSGKAVPGQQTRRSRPGKLDPYREYIRDRLSGHPVSAAQVYREIQRHGYSGGYTLVRDYVRKVRPAGVSPPVRASGRTPRGRSTHPSGSRRASREHPSG